MDKDYLENLKIRRKEAVRRANESQTAHEFATHAAKVQALAEEITKLERQEIHT
jgi:hypothetical protein